MSVGVLMAISSVEQEMDLVVSNFGFPIMVVFVQTSGLERVATPLKLGFKYI
jgi:hypothetical protein